MEKRRRIKQVTSIDQRLGEEAQRLRKQAQAGIATAEVRFVIRGGSDRSRPCWQL
jgi:hypothetical protein